MTEAWNPQRRSANYERARLASRKDKTPPFESASSIRDALLRAAGKVDSDSAFYDPDAMALVEKFEAALRRDWEEIERHAVEARAVAAVRDALATITDGRLL